MGKQTAQGTRHESSIRMRASAIGRVARRNAKQGQAHESDVTIEGQTYMPAVMWKNYVKREGRRKTVRMVVMLEEDWWKLVELDTNRMYGWEIQAKATERLGVRATLLGLLSWMGKP